MSFFTSAITHTLHGLQAGFELFLIAAGISIILGILGILNMAHGEFYAIGAYVSAYLFGVVASTVPLGANIFATLAVFVLVVVGSTLVLLPVGAVVEYGILRRLYDRHEIYHLLGTFAVILIVTDLLKLVFGSSPIAAPTIYARVNDLGLLEPFGISYPTYNFLIIIASIVSAVFVFYLFGRTKFGKIIRATAVDKDMAESLGIDVSRIFTVVFVLGAFFAGLAGAMVVPTITANLEMGTQPLLLSFIVIVIGGLGNIKGTFVAALIVGLFSAWTVWLYPPGEIFVAYVIMVVVLMVRPEGLFGTVGEIE